MGFPPALEQVAFEYWTLYMTHYAHFPRPLPRRLRHAETKRKGMEEANVAKRTEQAESAGEQGQDQHQTKDDTGSDTSSSSESSDSDMDDSYSMSESSDDDEGIQAETLSSGDEKDTSENGGKGEKRKPSAADPGDQTTDMPYIKPLRGANYLQKLKVDYTLAICFLSCHHLRQPVVFADLYKWVTTGDLPFYRASSFVPPKMLAKFSSDLHFVFLPRKSKSPDRLAQAVHQLSMFFERRFKIVQPAPNIPPLAFRFVQELMLPVETYPCAVRLCHIFFDMRPNDIHFDLATYGAIYTMGVVVMLAKLFIGLDGRARHEGNALDLMNTFPKEKDWLRMLDVHHSLRMKHDTPLFVGEYEYYRDLNPEGYKEMASRWMAQDPNIRELEPKTPQDTVSPELQAFLRRLFSTVEPPQSSPAFPSTGGLSASPQVQGSGSSKQPRALRPGENFVLYTHQQTLEHDYGAFLGNYERVVGHAANAVGISRDEMHTATATVEVSLFKWWAKISA
ncbi:Pol I core factor CF [Actinomortierella ambigua]|uniref:Pol I core factor CF n=1 Tax=Actinomortierella ambigua TaxID=1343610 RepID=A0A9P6U2N0_9FUNG|nr:Pol I core factor CF [Actinomortierella ambigua]